MSSGVEPVARFPTTAWSLVARAGVEAQREALSALLARYLPALRSRLVVDKRIAAEAADDLLQGFIADKVIEQGIVGRADPAKGKFRTFVLTALDHYVIDRARSAAARARAMPRSEDSEIQEISSPVTDPVHGFNVTWARQVIGEALRRMEAQCAECGRMDLWELFRCRVLDPALDGATPTPYEQLLVRFGYTSAAQASNALITAKRMFERALRGVVGEYAADEAEVEQELIDLRAILSGA